MSSKNIPELWSLKGRRALVTAAAGGFGTAISRALALHEAELVLTDINEKAVLALAESLCKAGNTTYASICDTTDTEQVNCAVDFAVEKLGGIDILINIAGVAAMKPILEMPEEEFNKTLNSCLLGAFRCSKAVAKIMVKQGTGGSIVHMSSIASLVALGRGTGAYASAKAGLNALVRELAVELAPHNIRVNAIAPCQFRTAGLETVLDDPRFGGREALTKQMLSKIPIGRLGECEDIVGPTIFLASDASAMVTGQTLFVDGGYTVI